MSDNKELVKVESLDRSWDDALRSENWTAPDVDIFETDDNYYIVANMPGVERGNVKVKLDSGNLVLMGRIQYEEAQSRTYILKESKASNYYRKFKISESVDESNIEAKFENGQLHLTLAKSEKMKTRVIDID